MMSLNFTRFVFSHVSGDHYKEETKLLLLFVYQACPDKANILWDVLL